MFALQGRLQIKKQASDIYDNLSIESVDLRGEKIVPWHMMTTFVSNNDTPTLRSPWDSYSLDDFADLYGRSLIVFDYLLCPSGLSVCVRISTPREIAERKCYMKK